ncbi:MAG: arsenite methyltransferase [Planctomycetota bacterium]|jgi:ubiquinone/menaquinone biosynthesis C-methylase UbiE
MSQSNEEIRKQVEEAYADRITEGASCCAPTSSCGSDTTVTSTVAALAGYENELAQHPEAGSSSFGCGNPLAFAGVEPGETVLDLGSGAGFDLLIAAEKVGPNGRVIGVDMTDAMIEKARENITRAGAEHIEVRKGIIEKLPVDDGSVDWVISNCVINLSPEKERVFGEVHRVLAPGGRISISDIVVHDLPEWARKKAEAYAACIGGAISESEYIAGLEKAGLADVTVTDRLAYTAEQLASFGETDEDREKLAGLAGRVQSLRFTGRKP